MNVPVLLFSEGLLPSPLGLSFVFTLILAAHDLIWHFSHYGVLGKTPYMAFFPLRRTGKNPTNQRAGLSVRLQVHLVPTYKRNSFIFETNSLEAPGIVPGSPRSKAKVLSTILWLLA